MNKISKHWSITNDVIATGISVVTTRQERQEVQWKLNYWASEPAIWMSSTDGKASVDICVLVLNEENKVWFKLKLRFTLQQFSHFLVYHEKKSHGHTFCITNHKRGSSLHIRTKNANFHKWTRCQLKHKLHATIWSSLPWVMASHLHDNASHYQNHGWCIVYQWINDIHSKIAVCKISPIFYDLIYYSPQEIYCHLNEKSHMKHPNMICLVSAVLYQTLWYIFLFLQVCLAMRLRWFVLTICMALHAVSNPILNHLYKPRSKQNFGWLFFGDAIWPQICWSTMAHRMTSCLTALWHYLNKWWLDIIRIRSQMEFQNAQVMLFRKNIILKYMFKIVYLLMD